MGTKEKFFKGIIYTGSAKYIGLFWNIVISAILARLLTPNDFGTVAIASVFIAFFYLLSDIGIGSAVVQFHDLTEDEMSSLFGWTVWLGALLTLIFFIMSFPIASFYKINQLVYICQLLSIQIFFTSINIVPSSILLRDKKFKLISLRNMLIQLVCGIISIAGAFLGMGLYALLINPVLGAIMSFAVNEISAKQRINIKPSIKPLKRIFKFSIFQFLFSVINYFANNLDKLIIGKTINVRELGYYGKAGGLVSQTISNLNGIFDPVLQTFMADRQNNPEAIKNVYTRMNKILLTISFPLSAILIICSKEIVLILFGGQWLPAVLPCMIVSMCIGWRISSSPTGGILLACKRTDILFVLGTINAVLAIIGLMIGAVIFRTIEAVCICGVIIAVLSFVTSYIAAYHFCFKSTTWPILKFAIKPILFSIIMLFIYFVFKLFLASLGLFTSLLIKFIISSSLCLIFWQFFTNYKPTCYGKIIMQMLNNRH